MAAAAPLAEAASQALRAQALGAQSIKARDFFREVCRCLPWTIKNYKLEELVSVPQLRGNIANMFRENAGVSTPEVINLLVYKGREELEMVLLQHKQRHHLITKYVAPFEHAPQEDRFVGSQFLRDFYKSNTTYG